jgi:HPt (histidine-containing phosphotransfer) domain-containing protein
VDEDLSDLIPGFLIHKRADVSAVIAAIARRDYAQISRIAHRIKGEGGSYGFATMTDLGRSLEGAATAHDDAAATAIARQLLDYLDHVEVVFQPSDD